MTGTGKYLASIVLLLLVIPAACVAVEALVLASPASSMDLIGKWFTFWACGVRLFLAGVMQVAAAVHGREHLRHQG
jgi:hypothetical protein